MRREKKCVNYYPFGLKHKGYNDVVTSTNTALDFKYNGKEFEADLGYNVYDYQARHYDPAIGRWLQSDPLAEQMRRHSPFNYAFNNPVFFIDPDGMAPQGPDWIDNGDGTFTAEDGDSASTLHSQHLKDKGYTFEETDAIVESQYGENRVEDGIEKSNIHENNVVKVQGEIDVIVFEKEQIEKKDKIETKITEGKLKKVAKLENDIDSISREISESYSKAKAYNGMADFDRKYVKYSNEGVGTGAAYALSAARNENDSVNNVIKRKELIKERAAINKTLPKKD